MLLSVVSLYHFLIGKVFVSVCQSPDGVFALQCSQTLALLKGVFLFISNNNLLESAITCVVWQGQCRQGQHLFSTLKICRTSLLLLCSCLSLQGTSWSNKFCYNLCQNSSLAGIDCRCKRVQEACLLCKCTRAHQCIRLTPVRCHPACHAPFR